MASSSPPPQAPHTPRARRAQRRLACAVLGLDLAAIVASTGLVWALHVLVLGGTAGTAGVDRVLAAWLQLSLLAGLWLAVLAGQGAYATRIFGAGTTEFTLVSRATLFAALGTSAACYATHSSLPAHVAFLVFAVGGVLLLGERAVVRTWVKCRRRAGHLIRKVLLVGSVARVRELAGVLAPEAELGYRVVGCALTASPPGDGRADLPAPVIGGTDDIRATVQALGVDTVMVAGGGDVRLRELAWDLEGLHIDFVVVPHLVDVSGPRIHVQPMAGLPLLHVDEPRVTEAADWPKRLFDLVGGVVALVVCAPLMLLIAALIKLHDGGPIFFRQTRVGLHGRLFTCWKFRSMSVGAEQLEAALRSEYDHEVLFKLDEDPRITRIGGFIRRYSIDELPQLFNVLNGTMSLVGPRPHLPLEVNAYSSADRRRLQVRPGMTGLWQVSGRADLSWREAVRMDLYYRDNWSMLTDLVILGRTVKAVLSRHGAY